MNINSLMGALASMAIAVIVVIVTIFIVNFIMTKIAEKYISTKKEPLRKMVSKRAARCRKIENQLVGEIDLYWEAVERLGLNKIIDCSSSIVVGATRDKTKYLIKYSNLSFDTESIDSLESLSQFVNEYTEFSYEMSLIAMKIKTKVPLALRPFVDFGRVGFWVCDIDEILYGVELPQLSFSYVSAAGRARRDATIELDGQQIDEVLRVLYSKVGKKKHSRLQRGKMTNDLREAIKKRDNYTCQICGNSVLKEPNLLLEVDHIVPISKGGKTEADNLQTLCWKCNREKGGD